MEDGTSLSVMFPITQYIWGPDRVLVKTDVLANEQYYYLYNGHGDVVQIVDVSGNVVNSYDYDVWGNFLKKEETIENHFTYFGQTYDEATGLYYLRARYYDPTIGRFISEDPIKTGMHMVKIIQVIKYFEYHKQGLVKVKYLYNNNILLNLFI